METRIRGVRMQRVRKWVAAILLVALVGGLFGSLPAGVKKAAAAEKFAATYNVTKKEFGAKSGKDSTKAIQAALDKAAKKGTAKKRVQVYLPAGTYYITKTLTIGSNTYLKCHKNAKIIKKSKNVLYMLRSAKSEKKGYNNIKNVTIEGGIWDAKFLKYNKETGGSLFFFAHSQNLEFLNLTLRNNYGTHLLELGGVKDVRIKGCKFYGFKKSSNESDKEAIQLDICHNEEILPGGGPFDDTPCRNITIEENEIYDYPRAIGSHSMVKDIYPSDIVIRNNRIHDISENAVYAYNYKNLTVTDNTFENVYAGVVFKSYAPEGEETIFKRNKGVKAMSLPGRDYNLTIAGNTIQTTSYSVSKETTQFGIFIYGTEAYGINGATISGNKIESASTGVYLRYVDNSVIAGNLCTRNNNSSGGEFLVDAYKFLSCSGIEVRDNMVAYDGNCYDNGFAFREKSNAVMMKANQVEQVGKHGIGIYSGSSAEITSNTIQKAGKHGIMVLEDSFAAITDNTILKSGGNGITVQKASATIDRNTISGSGQTGVSVQEKAEVSSLTENSIMENGGKAIAINQSTAPAVKQNKMSSKAGEFIVTAVDSSTNVVSTRNLTASEVTKNQEKISGTCQSKGVVYATVDGKRYDATVSQKTYEISIPRQAAGKTLTITQEDTSGNKVIETRTVK